MDPARDKECDESDSCHGPGSAVAERTTFVAADKHDDIDRKTKHLADKDEVAMFKDVEKSMSARIEYLR